MALRLRLLHRRLFRRERIFRDRTNPFDMYSDHDMFMRYRFGKGDLWQICDVLSDELSFANARLGSTSPIIQLLLTLRILACGGFLLDTGDSFGLMKATVGRLFDRVVTVLAGRLHQSARRVKCESDITLLDLDLVRSQTRPDTPTAQATHATATGTGTGTATTTAKYSVLVWNSGPPNLWSIQA